MKWRNVSLSLLGLTLAIVITLALINALIYFSISPRFDGNVKGSNLQFGYYDILSKNRELYDINFNVKDDVIMMVMRSPDDNRMSMKIRMQKQKTTPQGVLYDYKPVYMSGTENSLMVTHNMAYLEQGSILLDSTDLKGQNLLISSSGQIISNF